MLGAFGHSPASFSTTLTAIAQAFPPPREMPESGVPFSSARKWSAEKFADGATWVLGAPEVLLEKARAYDDLLTRANSLAESGWRVLLLARADGLTSEVLPDDIRPAALILFEEKVREDAPVTLSYFTEQGVAIKVISGDNPGTVAAVASRAGVPCVGVPVDARSLPEHPEELAAVMEKNVVFGRVNPDQKQRMVEALQAKGHVVAMTGDGVNDVLALKEADVGVAMGSGSSATRAVAQLVLLDGKFSTMPGVVAEGRRVIGNIERVANLFLAKTTYSTLLTIIIGLAGWAFLFLPRHLTLVSSLTIGAPALVLSFAPNRARYRPGFVKRVLRFSVPAGVVAALAALAAGSLSNLYGWINRDESRTMATLMLIVVGFWILYVLARPLNWWKGLLILTMLLGYITVLCWPWLRDFFALDLPSWLVVVQTAAIAPVAVIMLEVVWRLSGWRRLTLKEGAEDST